MSFTNAQFLFCGHMQWNTFKVCFKVLGGIRMAVFCFKITYLKKNIRLERTEEREREGGK